MPGSLHGCGPPSPLQCCTRQQNSHCYFHGGVGPYPCLRSHQVLPGSHERQRGFQRRHPLCLCSHDFLQHLCHLGPQTFSRRQGEDAPAKEEGLQDGADHHGDHRGQLPATCGSHAICVLLLICGVPLPDQHQCVLHHGPELQH